MKEILNAEITNVSLSMADHGCLTYGLTLKMGATRCIYGGICIGKGYLGADHFEGYAKGMEALMRIMDVIGVSRWEDIKGKYCRVESEGWGTIISKIGNIIEEKWFDQREFFSKEDK